MITKYRVSVSFIQCLHYLFNFFFPSFFSSFSAKQIKGKDADFCSSSDGLKWLKDEAAQCCLCFFHLLRKITCLLACFFSSGIACGKCLIFKKQNVAQVWDALIMLRFVLRTKPIFSSNQSFLLGRRTLPHFFMNSIFIHFSL